MRVGRRARRRGPMPGVGGVDVPAGGGGYARFSLCRVSILTGVEALYDRCGHAGQGVRTVVEARSKKCWVERSHTGTVNAALRAPTFGHRHARPESEPRGARSGPVR